MKITWEAWAVAAIGGTLTFAALKGWGTWAGALIFVAVLVWIIMHGRSRSVREWRRQCAIQACQQIVTTGLTRADVEHQEAA